MLRKCDIAAVQVIVASFTLGDAFNILLQLNPTHLNQIHYVETANGVQDFVFEELGNNARNQCARLPTFWRTWYKAGPPDKRTWVYGSLCQFVADALLMEVVAQGEEYVTSVVRKVLSIGAP